MDTVLIEFSPQETKAALVQDGRLAELLVEPKENESLIGNIYVGVIKNILPGKFVFIDIGLGQNAFMQTDAHRERISLSESTEEGRLREGQCILVQILKDRHGEKGPLVTTQIAFQGKRMVLFFSAVKEVAISKKIKILKERERLKAYGMRVLPEGFGLIMRTASHNCSEEEMDCEFEKLFKQGERLKQTWRYMKAPNLAQSQGNSLFRIVKDLAGAEGCQIVLNNQTYLSEVENAVFSLGYGVDRIQVQMEGQSIFREYFISAQIEEAQKKKVWLRSGGYILIEETSACVIIDVNSGKFLGKKDQQSGILKINLEAAQEAARQMRLRNLSGIIMIDFIDLKYQKDRNELLEGLREYVRGDRMRVHVLGMAHLGIVQMTREKQREPLSSIIGCQCPVCKGSGRISKIT